MSTGLITLFETLGLVVQAAVFILRGIDFFQTMRMIWCTLQLKKLEIVTFVKLQQFEFVLLFIVQILFSTYNNRSFQMDMFFILKCRLMDAMRVMDNEICYHNNDCQQKFKILLTISINYFIVQFNFYFISDYHILIRSNNPQDICHSC